MRCPEQPILGDLHTVDLLTDEAARLAAHRSPVSFGELIVRAILQRSARARISEIVETVDAGGPGLVGRDVIAPIAGRAAARVFEVPKRFPGTGGDLVLADSASAIAVEDRIGVATLELRRVAVIVSVGRDRQKQRQRQKQRERKECSFHRFCPAMVIFIGSITERGSFSPSE